MNYKNVSEIWLSPSIFNKMWVILFLVVFIIALNICTNGLLNYLGYDSENKSVLFSDLFKGIYDSSKRVIKGLLRMWITQSLELMWSDKVKVDGFLVLTVLSKTDQVNLMVLIWQKTVGVTRVSTMWQCFYIS